MYQGFHKNTKQHISFFNLSCIFVYFLWSCLVILGYFNYMFKDIFLNKVTILLKQFVQQMYNFVSFWSCQILLGVFFILVALLFFVTLFISK